MKLNKEEWTKIEEASKAIPFDEDKSKDTNFFNFCDDHCLQYF